MNGRKLLFRLANNWPAKVLSVALALALVVVYRVSTLSTRTLSVPLAVETSHALIPASEFPGSVRVTLRGDEEGVRSIADGDIEAFLDLSRHEFEGWYRSPVQIRRRGTALEVEPLEISVNPTEVSVRLDRRISMVLPLVAPVQGSVASGFDLVSHSISPAEVSVSGPVGILGDLVVVNTSPVVLEGRSSDFSVQVGIINPSNLLSIREGAAEFRGLVRPAVPVRNIEAIPITLSGLPPGLAADWDGRTGSVRIEGSWDRIDAFSPPPGFLSVDGSAVAEPGTHVLPVRVSLPEGFALIRQEPESLVLEVTLYGYDEPEEEDTQP
ncbi:MAG: CdaR family protein [Treponema sp.]|nr:CdaR family protein [Treponema sp.]